jgi:putative addiction module component (TIGR02574 family)
MSAMAEQLRGKLAGLSEADRAELALFLIHSLDHGTDIDAEAAWDTELQKREEEIRSGRATGEPAKEVFSELRKKHS